MCDPVTAAGLALSAGGTFLQSREAAKNERRVASARNAAFVENMNRGNQFAAEAGSIQANNTRNQSRQAFDENRAIETDKQIQAFNDVRTQPDYNTGLTSNAPKNVVIARQRAAEEAGATTDRDVANNAALQSFGNALFNSGLDQSSFARLFGNIQDKAGANTRMLPLEISAAGNNVQKSPSLFPTLLKAAGQGMSIYGAGSGTTSFFDKPGYGPLKPGQEWGDLATPGLFTKVGQLPARIF